MTDDLARFIAERLDEMQAGAEAATQGSWFWAEPSQEAWPCGDEPLQASQVAWDRCPYYCTWSEPSDVHRGEPGKPGHEHLRTVEVIGSWGHDAYGLCADDADKRHIVAWQPTRVLAFVAAGRAILAEHGLRNDRCDEHDASCRSTWCPTLRAFGMIWAGHPAWREEWSA